MTTKRPDIFVSATSGDLGQIRELAKHALLSIDCHPVEQTNFPPDYREVEDMLRAKIADCDAVLHIVGIRYGAEPDPATLPEGKERLSYTQLEAQIARELGKRLYLFLCPEDFPFGEFPEESSEKVALQQAYRANLSADKQLYTPISDENEVSLRVRELQTQVESLKHSVTSLEDNLQESQKSHKKLFLLSSLGILLLGTLGWFGYQQTRKDTASLRETVVQGTLDQSRIDAIRLNSTRRINKDYDAEVERIKNDPELADDWKKRKDLTDQATSKRDSLLASLERFIESAQASYQAGEVLPELEEFLRIAASKEGIQGALAYYQTIKSEHAAEGKKLDAAEAEVTAQRRAHYRLDLEAANATVTAGDWDQAETFYLDLIKKINNWGDPPRAYVEFLLYSKGPDQEKYHSTEEALATYQQARHQTEFLTQLEPDSTDYRREKSVSYNQIGNLQLRLGNTKLALEFFQKFSNGLEELTRLDPNNSQFKRDLSISYNKLGDLQLRLGNTEQALEFFHLSLYTDQELTRLEPKNSQFKRDLSISYDWVGDLQLCLGNATLALEFFQLALDSRKELNRLDPNDSQLKRDLSVSYCKLGDLQLHLGNTEQALEFFQYFSDGLIELIRLDPNNSQLKRDLSVSYDRLGDVQTRMGNTTKANDWYEESLDNMKRLVKLDPQNSDFKRGITIPYDRLGDLQLRLGNTDKAFEFIQLSLSTRKELTRLDPNNSQLKCDLSLTASWEIFSSASATPTRLSILFSSLLAPEKNSPASTPTILNSSATFP